MFICRIVIESEELLYILWKRIQFYFLEFDVLEEVYFLDLYIYGVFYLLRGKWKLIGLNKVNKDFLFYF